MKKLGLMLALGMMVASGNTWAAENCNTTPDCASLGYTMKLSECEGAVVLYCPWDTTKVACGKCKIGSILGGDGRCYSATPPSGITPVGIVFDTTNRLAVALTDVKKDGTAGRELMAWNNVSYSRAPGNTYNIPALQNCSNGDQCDQKVNLTTCGTDGQNNTKLILQYNSTYHEAAIACNKYEPSGCQKDFCKKTKWFLPSMRDLLNIQSAKSEIVRALIILGRFDDNILWNGEYWSSTENVYHNAWIMNFGEGIYYSCFANKDNKYYVRPVVKY